MDKNGGLLEASALKRSEEALKIFSAELSQSEIEVVATAAARKARNADQLAEMVKKHLGSPMRILSGEEEAIWSQKGARIAAESVFGKEESFSFIDLGGASTEISFSEENSPRHSFPVGAVSLLEALGLDEIPTSDSRWLDAKKSLSSQFEQLPMTVLENFSRQRTRRAIAVGGTLVIAAQVATCQDPVRRNDFGILCRRSEFAKFNENLRLLDREDRQKLSGMEPGREDIMTGGLLALDYLLMKLGCEEVFVTSWGLRHGLLFGKASNR